MLPFHKIRQHKKIVYPLLVAFILILFFQATLMALYTETRLTTDPDDQGAPRISGDRVIYEDDRNGNFDIYLYDLSTNTETQITSDPDNQTMPDISGDRVVYEDDRNGNFDIYMYDLGTLTETQITTRSL